MRQGPNGRRPRGRPNRKQQGGPSRPNNFDSSGPEGRIRGNAHQVYEKYVGLARDAISAGDRVAAETYYQHAEHYFRIVNASTDPVTAERRPARDDGNGRDADGREPRGPDSRDRSAREQDVNSDRNVGEPEPARSTPSETAQPAQVEPPRAAEGQDREGLDRVLGRDGADSPSRNRPRAPQGAVSGPADRDTEQAPTRRRPRQRPARSEAAGPANDGAERQADRSGNGDARVSAPAQDQVSTAPSEPAEATAPDVKNPDSEPAGA